MDINKSAVLVLRVEDMVLSATTLAGAISIEVRQEHNRSVMINLDIQACDQLSKFLAAIVDEEKRWLGNK